MSGPSSQPLGHVWLSQEDLRSARGPAPDHAPLSPQSSIASSGSGGSEHLEEAGLGGSSLHRSSFHEEGSGMRGECDSPALTQSADINLQTAPQCEISHRLLSGVNLVNLLTPSR